MEMLRKFAALLLVFVLLLLAACANAGEVPAESSDTPDSVLESGEDSGTDTSKGEEPKGEAPKGEEPKGEEPNGDEVTDKKIMLNKAQPSIKLLDERMTVTSGGTVCDWSCAGIEFVADCEGDITFSVSLDGGSGCYFRAYIDGNSWKNGSSDYYPCMSTNSTVTLRSIPKGTHTVRLVKATGYTLARTTLKSIELTGSVAETAPADKELYIGYVGDSIFCGYGVIGNYDGKYDSQDGTLAIPYLVSETLGADFSVVALSGQGAAIGDPNVEVGYKYASPARDKSAEFSFERKADIVVVNIGTNDYSNQQISTPQAFSAAYKRLLQYIKAKNGEDCKILAVYNVMNDTYATQILSVIGELGGSDNGYYTLKLDRTAKVHTSHPTYEENLKYSEIICSIIPSILDGTYVDGIKGTSDWFEYEKNVITGDRLTVTEDSGFGGELDSSK